MKIIIAIDFDNTITLNNDKTAMGCLEKILPKDYLVKRNLMYSKEKMNKINNMYILEKVKIYDDMWTKKFKYVENYKITDADISKLLDDVTIKNNFNTFVKYLYENNIPLIINSAGLGNFIKLKLEKEKLLLPNVKIISNYLYKNEKYVTVYNKSQIKSYQEMIKDAELLIIIGDSLGDLTLIPDDFKKDTISIAFPRDKNILYNKYFDYVVKKEDFEEIIKVVKERISNEKNN